MSVFLTLLFEKNIQASSSKSGTLTSCKSDSNDCVTPRPAQSTHSISFSGQTTECNVESGVLSSAVAEENPYDIMFSENQFSSAVRDDAVLRYKEKRKSRK